MNIRPKFLYGVCDKCPFLNPVATVDALYSDEGVFSQHIDVTCGNIKECSRTSRIMLEDAVRKDR